MIKQILLVGLGGGVGSMLRFVASLISTKYFDFKIPIATLIVNVLGSLLIGIILAYLHKSNAVSSDLKFLLAIGFCGGFTTFSTFAWENLQLFNNQQYFLAILYTLLSLLLCFVGVAGGYFLIKS
ncbi:MAG: fluoride efflux transporter CrcB [Bacteroidales bacterium]|nr:fluoride efflux transporter CrcB [Bacteroidales bacterium]